MVLCDHPYPGFADQFLARLMEMVKLSLSNDSSGHAERNFVFTGSFKSDSNETAATRGSTK